MILEDIASAFITEGLYMKAIYSTLVPKAEILLQQNEVKRYLCSEKLDPTHALALTTEGEIEVNIATLYIFSNKPETSVENLKSTLVKIYKTNRGYLGKGKRPVDFSGIRFWLFDPYDTTIKTDAIQWRPPWGPQGGYWVSDCTLRIAAKKI